MGSSNIIFTVIISIVSLVVLFLLAILIAMRKSNKEKRTKRNKTAVSKNLKTIEKVAPAKDYNAETKKNSEVIDSERKNDDNNKQMPTEKEKLMRPRCTEENLRWPLFEEKELKTMGWEFLFCKKEWDEVNILLENGDYNEAEKKTLEFKEKYMDSLMMFDLLLLEAQHRKGDFNACSETYQNTNRPSLAFFSAKDKTPLVLEYCEAMLDLQGTIPGWIQLAWKGAHECLDNVMRANPPERSYVICIRAFKAALDIGRPLFGGNEEALIQDYIKSGLSRYPESKTLLELKSEFN